MKPRSDRRKAYQSATWARAGEQRRASREAQNERMRKNIELRRAGKPTPWQAACQLRLERRAAVRAALAASQAAGGRS